MRAVWLLALGAAWVHFVVKCGVQLEVCVECGVEFSVEVRV